MWRRTRKRSASEPIDGQWVRKMMREGGGPDQNVSETVGAAYREFTPVPTQPAYDGIVESIANARRSPRSSLTFPPTGQITVSRLIARQSISYSSSRTGGRL